MLFNIITYPNNWATLVFGHLVYKESWHGAVWILSNHICDFSTNYFTTLIFSSNCFYQVDLNIRVYIFTEFLCHSLCHRFVASCAVAKSVIVIISIFFKIIANNWATRRNKGHWRTYALVSYFTAIFYHYFSNFQHSRACYFLDFCHIVFRKPLEIFGSHSFKIN